MNDYWLSRRPRFTVDEAFRIGMYFILEGSTHCSLRPLELAARMGHEEATFIIDSLKEWKYYEPDRYGSLSHWAFSLYDNGKQPRALKYVVWFPMSKNFAASSQRLKWIQELAEQGEPIGQYLLARHLNKMNHQDGVELYTKAADQNFTPAYHKLIKLLEYLPGDEVNRAKKLHREGCVLGNWHCLRAIIDEANRYEIDADAESANDLMKGDLIQFRILQQFIKSGFRQDIEKLIYILRQLNHNESRSVALGEIYLTGRMFDDYQACYPKLDDKAIRELGRECTVIYRQMICKARQASIQTILAMRAVGVCRDVAILIARVVFRTRSQAVWYTKTN